MSENEMIYLARQGNKVAYSNLYHVYCITLKIMSRHQHYFGKRIDDLFIESIETFNQILYSYNKSKGATFMTYINVCVTKRFNTHTRKPLPISFSLDQEFSYLEKRQYSDVISDEKAIYQPEFQVIYHDVIDHVEYYVDTFSSKEIVLFELFLMNHSINEISSILNENLKKVYNERYRVLKKIRAYSNSFDY